MKIINKMERESVEEQKYILAKKRVEKIKGFYIHSFITIIVIAFLIFINLKFSPQFHWFWFPVFGMGIGLFFHWLGIFGSHLFFGKDWEKKQIEKHMNDNKF